MQSRGLGKFYISWLRRRAFLVAFVLVLSLADAWISIRLPFLMSIAIDRIIALGLQDELSRMIGRMLVLALGGSVAGLLIMSLSALLAQDFGDELRRSLFHRIMSWSWEQQSTQPSGKLLTRLISDTQVLSQFFISLLQTLIRPLLIILFSLFSLWRLGSRYLVMVAAAAPVEGVLLWFMMTRIKPRFTAMQIVLEKTNGYVQKMLSSLRLIRVNRRIPDEQKRYDGMNQELYDSSMAVQQLIAAMNPLLIFILNLAIVGTLWISGWQAGSSSEGMGSILAAILYLQQLLMCLLTVGQLFQSWSRFQISQGRINEIEAIAPEVTEWKPLPEGELTLRCENASYRYPRASSDTLSSVSMKIPQGSFVALAGPTGAGKSTLCRLLAGLLRPGGGEAAFGGMPAYQVDHSAPRGGVQLVPQTSAILSDSVWTNISFGASDFSREEIQRAASVAQADAFIQSLPHGYDTVLAQGGTSLSGGQRQCIALARALVRRPRVLILDDSCSAMDFQTEKNFLQLFRQEYAGTTLIFVSNRIPSLQRADWIQVLESGRTTDHGSHDELCARNEFYRTASQIQTGGGA